MNTIDMPGHLIRRLHQQSTQVFQARMTEAGVDLTPVQFAALDAVAAAPGIDQARLAETIGFDRATIGGVVERLEGKGLLARQVADHDRRARALNVTRAGQRLLCTIRPVVQGLQAEILAPLTPAQRSAFVVLARKALGLG